MSKIKKRTKRLAKRLISNQYHPRMPMIKTLKDSSILVTSKSLSVKSVFLSLLVSPFPPWLYYRIGRNHPHHHTTISQILRLECYCRLIGFAGTMDSGGPMSLFWGFVCTMLLGFLLSILLTNDDNDDD